MGYTDLIWWYLRTHLRSFFLLKMYLFNRYLLSTYFVPKAVLEKADNAVNKTDKFRLSRSLRLSLYRFNKNISGRDGDSGGDSLDPGLCVGGIARPTLSWVAVFELACCRGKPVSLTIFSCSLSILLFGVTCMYCILYTMYLWHNFSVCNKVINKEDRNASFVNKALLFLKI